MTIPPIHDRRCRPAKTLALSSEDDVRAMYFAVTTWNDSVMHDISIKTVYTAVACANPVGPNRRAVTTLYARFVMPTNPEPASRVRLPPRSWDFTVLAPDGSIPLLLPSSEFTTPLLDGSIMFEKPSWFPRRGASVSK